MARMSYYLNGEVLIDSEMSMQELERLIEEALTVYRNGVQVTPVTLELHSPRRA